jgi:hypothetical protein
MGSNGVEQYIYGEVQWNFSRKNVDSTDLSSKVRLDFD